MPPLSSKSPNRSRKFSDVQQWIWECVVCPKKTWIISIPLFIFECMLSVFVVHRVKYTEIDWVAYMQEVEGFLNGTLDYSKLAGQTGPLVYPAGFVYFYSFLYYLTDRGASIRFAQYIFILLFLLNLLFVFGIYIKTSKVPPFGLVFMCCTSYRVHSIFMLRLFNDPVAMLFLYAAVNALLHHRYSLACLSFSLGVSMKMNVLLFAPGLLLILLCNRGVWETLGHLAECGLVQLVLAIPFLIHNTSSYLGRAFEFQRQFLFKWTVNWRFLPVEWFEHRGFHAGLLLLHVVLLAVFMALIIRRHLHEKRGTMATLVELGVPKEENCMNSDTMVLAMFVVNLIGVSCSRSLHYQFYVWYYHSLGFLLWHCQYRTSVRLLVLGLVELCWNVYPSTVWSSALLHLQHLLILAGLAWGLCRGNGIFRDKKTL